MWTFLEQFTWINSTKTKEKKSAKEVIKQKSRWSIKTPNKGPQVFKHNSNTTTGEILIHQNVLFISRWNVKQKRYKLAIPLGCGTGLIEDKLALHYSSPGVGQDEAPSAQATEWFCCFILHVCRRNGFLALSVGVRGGFVPHVCSQGDLLCMPHISLKLPTSSVSHLACLWLHSEGALKCFNIHRFIPFSWSYDL